MNTWDWYLSIGWYVSAVSVTGNWCNEDSINVVDLSWLKFVGSVVIGNRCLKYVEILWIVGVNWVEWVSIGSISCGSDGCIWEGSELKIVNCVELKSLSIGSGWFVG